MKPQHVFPLAALLTSYQTLNPATAFAETPAEKSETSKTAEEPQKEQVHGMVEVMAGHQSGTLDTKLSLPIAPNTKIFNRNRITGLYEDGSVSSFHAFMLTYSPFVQGLDLVAEVDAISGVGLEPRTGIQYFRKLDDFKLAGFTSVSLQENPTGLFLVNLSYNPKFNDIVGLATNAELITTVGEDGHNYSIQRLRLGVNLIGYQVGPALDLKEATNHQLGETAVSYNLGGFLKTNF